MHRWRLRTQIVRWTIVASVTAAVLAPLLSGYRSNGGLALKLSTDADRAPYDHDVQMLSSTLNSGEKRRQGIAIVPDGAELSDDQIERQIDELIYINDKLWYEMGRGFLPKPAQYVGLMSMFIDPPKAGSADYLLRPLVASGLKAVPHLLAHLSDRRRTDMMVIGDSGANGGIDPTGTYDTGAPTGIWNKVDLAPKNAPRGSHILTVGDLCFIALGQIVDREFWPVTQRHRGGMEISSPSSTPALAAAAIKEWGGLTPERHIKSLINDFYNGVEGQALHLLAYYYPDAAEKIALEQLARPMFSWDIVYRFREDSLYTTRDPAQWKSLSNNFIARFGPAFKDGLIELLVSDCDSLDRGHPLKKQDARLVFACLFPNIDRKTWSNQTGAIEQARVTEMIRNLMPLRSAKVDEEVYRHFQTVNNGAFDANQKIYFAAACMERLIGKGHDQEFFAYCIKNTSPNQDNSQEQLQVVFKQLQKSVGEH